MSEFQPITSIEDLALQPDMEMQLGYLAGLNKEPEPGSDKSRAYWHGWRNGMVDGGHAEIDDAQQRLAWLIVASQRTN